MTMYLYILKALHIELLYAERERNSLIRMVDKGSIYQRGVIIHYNRNYILILKYSTRVRNRIRVTDFIKSARAQPPHRKSNSIL